MSDETTRFVAAAFRGHGRSRSKMYLWMVEHFEMLSEAKAAGRRVDWISVTAEMKALGFTGAGKKSLKPENVRRTWHRVCADVKAGVSVPGQISGTPVVKPGASPESKPGVRQSATTSSPQSTEEILSMLSPGRKLPDPVNPTKRNRNE